MATEPMTDDMLDAINALLHDGRGGIPDLWLSQLFDEVCRARAHEQALAAENKSLADRLELLRAALRQGETEIAAMRPMVEAVAKLESRETHENPIYPRDLVLHSDDINVLWLREQARAFVAAHPTAAGETAADR